MKNKLTIKHFTEEDLSDDVDDEVFVRDGKHQNQNSIIIEKTESDEQPLMPVRRKLMQKQNSSSPEVCSRQPCNIYNCLLPAYFAIATIVSIAVLMLMYILLVEKLPLIYNQLQFWSLNIKYQNNVIVPCSNIKLNDIWMKKIPKLTSDSQIKLVDVNNDNVSDIIIGIGTEYTLQTSCSYDFERKHTSCLGAVIALDGKTGNTIWQCWFQQMVLALHCDLEINGDNIYDCIATGKGGLFIAISGYNGSIIWQRKPVSSYEIYNILITQDINQDSYLDIIAGHYLKEKEKNAENKILIISGKTNKMLQQLKTPFNEPILHAPQILTDSDGNENVYFITGDLNHPGGIYVISLQDLIRGDSAKIKMLYHFDAGILASPIMIDMNLDGVQDIIFVVSNTVFVLDGMKYELIWNISLHNYVSYTYQITVTSSITPAYFNDDLIPDLLIMFPIGSGFPEYYYSMILVLNGKTGESLLRKPIIRSGVTDTVSALALSFSGVGNDAFIYWTVSCKNFVDAKTAFSFMPEENKPLFSDLCCLRFNSTSQLQLYALNQHIEPPGKILYNKEYHEHENSTNLCFQENDNEIDEFVYNVENSRENAPMSFIRGIFPSEKNYLNEKQVIDINDDEWRNSRKSDIIHKRKNKPLKSTLYDDIKSEINNYDISDRQDDRTENTKNIQFLNENNLIRTVPKVSASGIITKSIDGNNLDIILMHHEILVDTDICIIIDNEKKCTKKRMSSATISESQTNEKINHDDILIDSSQNYLYKKNVDEKNLHMSNLYISRHRLSCTCDLIHLKKKEICSRLLPYEKQSYPAYLGRFGNSAYKMRNVII